MAFGGGGFGGFGQSNTNNNTNSTFGGFGSSNNNTTSGFGTSNNTFGTSNANTGSSIFGNNNNNTSSAFGSGGAFGASSSSAFGSRPAFGTNNTTSGASLFGSGTATSGGGGFGGFGSSSNTNTGTGFGNTSSGTGLGGSSLFGGGRTNTTSFGASNTNTGTSLFGGNNNNTSAFGGTPATAGFGTPASTALGQNPTPNNGTGTVPFSVIKEREGTSSIHNHYQTISFIGAYQNYSLEELRLVDYQQGRRYGTGNQAGAFGTSTSFGMGTGSGTGFGNSSTTGGSGLFGSNNNNTSSNLFGSNNNSNTSTAFGSTNTGGGLFGNKSSTTGGGLFGGAASSSQPSTSLFGTSNNNTSAFGSGNTAFGSNTNNTGSSLFSKPAAPAGAGFGAASSSGFGQPSFGSSSNTTSGGLFGTSSNTNNQPSGSAFGGGFGTQNQTNQSGSIFGGGNTFGASANKPAFGTLGGNTGGGIFGNAGQQSQPQQSNSLFGNASSSQSTGLFGKPNATPAAGGSGLFGGANSGGGGLFGSNTNTALGTANQNQTSGSSIFGKPAGGGIFGASNTANTNTGGLFNNANNNQPAGGSLFGNTNAQANQTPNNNSILGASILGGASQNTPQQLHQGLYTSLNDPNAYGNSTGLFSGLASVHDLGPVATPLSGQKQKKTTLAPSYKQNGASRLVTPSRPGFGFSYSRYGTPGSAMSVTSNSPLALSSGGLLRSSMARSLGKSFSTSNLRRTYEAEESILAPGAFTATSRPSNLGLKSLQINRRLKPDLFSHPPSEAPQQAAIENGNVSPSQKGVRKHVSFDAAQGSRLTNGSATNGSSTLELSSSSTGSKNSSSSSATLSDHSHGKELAVVRENEREDPVQILETPMNNGHPSHDDQEAGEYSTKPSLSELKAMSPEQLKRISNFTVSRKGCGFVAFNEPVDLTGINLDDLCGGIIQIIVRSITVYPDTATKPPVGQGLNTPATISLQNSWPRARGGKQTVLETAGPRFNRHVARLKKVTNCDFKSYDAAHGIWTFTVPHFTTYGLPDEDDETDVDEFTQSFSKSSQGGPVQDIYSPNAVSVNDGAAFDLYSDSEPGSSNADDTFDFQRRKRQQISRMVPGAFDGGIIEDTISSEEDKENKEPFLDDRSMGSSPGGKNLEDSFESSVDQDDELVQAEDDEMAITTPQLDQTMELDDQAVTPDAAATKQLVPKSILKKASVRRLRPLPTPSKALDLDADWTQRLQGTVSPKKQDRTTLREQQQSTVQFHSPDRSVHTSKQPAADGRDFGNSIDLMRSLYGRGAGSDAGKSKRSTASDGFQWPYAKRPKTVDGEFEKMSSVDRGFYSSFRPKWTTSGTLVCTASPETMGENSQLFRASTATAPVKDSIVSEGRDVQFISFQSTKSSSSRCLEKLYQKSRISHRHGIPIAKTTTTFRFEEFADDFSGQDAQSSHEKSAWNLAGVLFDKVAFDMPENLPAETLRYIETRARKDALSSFWVELVLDSAARQIELAKSPEAKAIGYLSTHNIEKACTTLIDGKDFRLATLTSLIGGDKELRKDMREQLATWRERGALPEFEEAVRAIYELIAGNTCVCEGQKGTVEFRAKTFVISEEFGLNWRQSFGLRLWYAIFEGDPIQAAVQKFREDLDERQVEPMRPVPWFVEQRVPPLWSDDDQESRSDLLWSLLQLFADFEESQQTVDIVEILLPHNHQLSPLDYRLSWLLFQTLGAKNVVRLPSSASNGELVLDEKIDRLTGDYAWQLERAGEWYWAIFVLLHLQNDGNRKVAIQESLARHAGSIGDEYSPIFRDLTVKLEIPDAWIWEAKALFLRSAESDPISEVGCLIKAGNWAEAHVTFCSAVGPQAVIANDLDTIHKLLDGFVDVNLVKGWDSGGQAYLDYANLKALVHSRGQKKNELELNHQIHQLASRLSATLPSMVTKDRRPEFLTRIAVQEISSFVAKIISSSRGIRQDVAKILHLPLTEDGYLRHSVDLSMKYYSALNGAVHG